MADIDLAELERRKEPRFFEPARIIGHDEAREIAGRFINMHFNKEGEHSRASIPADPERDDDLLICAYIAQRRREETALLSRVRALEAALRRLADIADNVANNENVGIMDEAIAAARAALQEGSNGS